MATVHDSPQPHKSLQPAKSEAGEKEKPRKFRWGVGLYLVVNAGHLWNSKHQHLWLLAIGSNHQLGMFPDVSKEEFVKRVERLKEALGYEKESCPGWFLDYKDEY